jgi:hypothetical protein
MFFTIRRSGGRFLRGGTSKKSDQQRGPPSRSAKSLRQVAPPSRSAKSLRQVAAPTATAKLLRQSESANERAPTAGDHLTPTGACRSSHRSVLNSRGSNSHRHRRHRQRGPPNRSAKSLRQLTPPSCSASQRAPSAGDHLTPPGTCRSSHRSVLISQGSNSHRHRRHRQRRPPNRSAKSHRQLTPPSCSANQRAPTRERQPQVTNSPHWEPSDPRIESH